MNSTDQEMASVCLSLAKTFSSMLPEATKKVVGPFRSSFVTLCLAWRDRLRDSDIQRDCVEVLLLVLEPNVNEDVCVHWRQVFSKGLTAADCEFVFHLTNCCRAFDCDFKFFLLAAEKVRSCHFINVPPHSD